MAGEKYLIDIAAGTLPANGASASLTVEVHRDDTGAFTGLTPGAYGSRDFLRADEFTTQTVAAPDLTAPILSSPVDEANGATAATGSVSTDEGNGTLYWVATTSATAPSAAQVKLGQDFAGVAATASGSQVVSTTGVQTLSPAPSGLAASTAYTIHFMHEDAAGNPSLVASGDGFTTPAAAYSFTDDFSTGYTALDDVPTVSADWSYLAGIPGGTQTATISNPSGQVVLASNGSAGAILIAHEDGGNLNADQRVTAQIVFATGQSGIVARCTGASNFVHLRYETSLGVWQLQEWTTGFAINTLGTFAATQAQANNAEITLEIIGTAIEAKINGTTRITGTTTHTTGKAGLRSYQINGGSVSFASFTSESL